MSTGYVSPASHRRSGIGVPLRRLICISVALAAIRLALWALASLVQRRLNPTLAKGPYPISPGLQRLHDGLLIADLHADALLWGTDLSLGHALGHVDLPRLRMGNVALQVFGVVTSVPPPNREATFGEGADLITLLSMIQVWPPNTWVSLMERALYQARKLRQLEARSQGQFSLVTSAKALGEFLLRRAASPGSVAGLLALEGAHALQGHLSNVDVLYDAGFRMLSLTHLFDNEAGGSSLGTRRYGLTSYGSELVKRAEERGFIIDMAHASPALFDDILGMVTRPVLVSHCGAQGVCPNPRNLSDAQIRQVAQRGGLVGIGYDPLFTCASGVAPIADSIQYVASLVGVDYVALGSDFDGVIRPPFDASGLALLTAQLPGRGFSDTDIRKIMGENVIRFLGENLR